MSASINGIFRKYGVWLICVNVALTWTLPVFAGLRDYGAVNGYIADASREREEKISDLTLIEMPKEPDSTLRERIFNEQLSREFRDRYQQRFGYTEAQQAYNAPNKYSYYANLYGFQGTPQDNSEARRQFGEYMLRRLAEWHVENYAKTDPQARVVWEAKEKLSSVKVEVENFKFDVRYELAGNTMDLICKSPYADAKVTLQMNPAQLGPGPLDETILTLSREVTRSTMVETHYLVTEGVVSVVGRKNWAPSLSSSLTTSTFTLPTGKLKRESLYLAGVSYSF